MKCPQCGKEVPENTNFCPTCGFNFSSMPRQFDNPAHEVNNLSTTNGSGGAVDLSYHDDPVFKKKVVLMNILGAIGFVFSGLGCFASTMLKFGENISESGFALYIVLLVLGLLVGLIVAFVCLIPMGKKYFPDQKPRGFLENLPGVWLGFTISFVVIALVFQGFMLIIS